MKIENVMILYCLFQFIIYQLLYGLPQCKLRKSFFGYAGSFAGLVYLSWYLSGKVRVFDRRGHIAKLCLVLLPVLLAALIAVSRVDDYWHHWQDVFAGGLIG